MNLSPEEIKAIQALPRDTPYLITGVSRSQFSVARYYGGARYNSREYTYDPTDDTLVRGDVLKAVMGMRRNAARKTVVDQAARQIDLLPGVES